MSELITNFVSAGIQQVAFAVPIFQIKECESNVGSALTKGYLFAAATPLSISGSLGVLKQGFIFWMLGGMFPQATFHFRRDLLPKELKFRGAVSSLLNPEGENINRLEVERKFVELVKGLNVKNLHTLKVTHEDQHWKAFAIGFSLLAVICSVTPYIHSIYDQRTGSRGNLITAISFPLVRAFGSLVITVTIQYVLRHRLLTRIRDRIIFMTITEFARKEGIMVDRLSGVTWDETKASEDCIKTLQSHFSKFPSKNIQAGLNARHNSEDIELGRSLASINLVGSLGYARQSDQSDQRSAHECLRRRFSGLMEEHWQDHRLGQISELARQFCLLIGVLFSIYGYFGSFVLIQNNSKGSTAPITWLLMELALSMARSSIWAWDPGFDEATGIRLSYEVAPPGTHSIGGGERRVFPVIKESEIRRIENWRPLILHRQDGSSTRVPNIIRSAFRALFGTRLPGGTLSVYYMIASAPEDLGELLHLVIADGDEAEVFCRHRNGTLIFYTATIEKDKRGDVTVTVSGANPRNLSAFVDGATLDKICTHYCTYRGAIVALTKRKDVGLTWDLTEQTKKSSVQEHKPGGDSKEESETSPSSMLGDSGFAQLALLDTDSGEI